VEAVIRAVVIYSVLYLLMRVSGKRTLSDMNAFDLLLLLIISEATQQAMVDNDHSITHSVLLITSLVGCDILLSLVKRASTRAENLLDSTPLLLVADGSPIAAHLHKERVSEEDILTAARETQGLTDLKQIRYAVLESNGKISIIPA
jgi:uncharacterized membrane protein YcaP (DUF421 family)